MTDARPLKIGIYDSGVGGLSVVDCLRKDIPSGVFFYCSDNLNFPYGTKSDAEVIRFTVHSTAIFSATYGLDLLVIACNTASTIALNEVRASIGIPVVGVVPAIKPAAAVSKTRTIALLATPATIGRAYTRKLINDFAGDCKVILRGSSVLVELAEKKLRGEIIDLQVVGSELQPMFAASGGASIDTVVLGCTHFPLLRAELEQVKPSINWIESGPAIAARTRSLLISLHATSERSLGPHSEHSVAVFTSKTNAALSLQTALAKFGFEKIEFPVF